MPNSQRPPATETKIDKLLALLGHPEGAGISELTAATGWQPHSVRGAIAGTIKKKLGHRVETVKEPAGTVYRIPAEPGPATPHAPRAGRKKGGA